LTLSSRKKNLVSKKSVGRAFIIIVDSVADNDEYFKDLDDAFEEIVKLPIRISFGVFSAGSKDVSKIKFKFGDLFEDSDCLCQILPLKMDEVDSIGKILRVTVGSLSDL
jgi:hypothetical protein